MRHSKSALTGKKLFSTGLLHAFSRHLGSRVALLGVVASLSPAFAQYGGRPGDVIIYMVSAKGSPDFRVVPDSTVNTKTGFVIEDPNDLPKEQFGPDFPAESRRKMHAEAGDVFNVITQLENDSSPHQQLLETVKVFVAGGVLRLKPADQPPIDITAGLFVPFPKTIDFGPNEAMIQSMFLMWTPAPFFPATTKAPDDYRSPNIPSQFPHGINYLIATGTFDTLVPWVPLRTVYPGNGWQQGIDTRVIEIDDQYGTKIQMLRLRPGKATPTFRISANTHLFVLSGQVTITPASGTASVMKKNIYAFVPPDFAIRLSNPAEYQGPVSH